MPEKIVRTVCFSHAEPYLEWEGKRYQLVARIFEVFGKTVPFDIEIQLWNQSDEKFTYRSYDMGTLKESLDYVTRAFDALSFNGIPEVLYLPEWSKEEEAKKNIGKWADNIFGLGNSGCQKQGEPV